ncbi:MAG: hypothetical protein AAFY65_03590 [Pseudomonadota bacterium]
MTLSNLALWQRVRDYVLPLDSGNRTFEEQLIVAHGINRRTAKAAILEYRKFLYLAAISDRRVVPSRAVDAVWHLHLGHTRDYWDRFCEQIGQRLHHTPGTPPGHGKDYAATLARYRAEFEQDPPAHFWHQPSGFYGFAGLALAAVLAAVAATGWLGDQSDAAFVVAGVIALASLPSVLRGLGVWKTPALRNQSAVPQGKTLNTNSASCGGGCGGGCGGD